MRIDLPAAYGRLHARGVILRCVEDHALLLPHISFSDRFVDPVEEDIDIVVRIGGSDIWPDALGRRYPGTERLVLCASPQYLIKHGEPRTEHDLEHHSCAAVLAGQGIAQLPTWLIKQALEVGTLVKVLPHLATDGLPMNLVWLKRRQ